MEGVQCRGRSERLKGKERQGGREKEQIRRVGQQSEVMGGGGDGAFENLLKPATQPRLALQHVSSMRENVVTFCGYIYCMIVHQLQSLRVRCKSILPIIRLEGPQATG